MSVTTEPVSGLAAAVVAVLGINDINHQEE